MRKPSLAMLADPTLLALAAKKAFKYVNRSQWYHDRTQSLGFMARLSHNVEQLSQDIRFGRYEPGIKTVFPAPKRIDRVNNKPHYVYRPLCIQPFRDEVVETTLLCLFADHFEQDWGDTENDNYPDVRSFGNRLHRVKIQSGLGFSVGNASLYRNWSDDYARFVRETEKRFNVVLTSVNADECVVLICTDIKSFYPTIDRAQLREVVKARSNSDLWPMVEKVFGPYQVDIDPTFHQGEIDLAATGLAQGPAHSGFWANVYLSTFDQWTLKNLSKAIRKEGIDARLHFYARYVDDMRFIFQCRATHSKQLIAAAMKEVDGKLAPMGLRRSDEKTNAITEDVTGSLLTTGQVAERMQSITKRAYFPLAPENLAELAKEVRLLFHAETVHRPKAGGPNEGLDEPPYLDNPGVRPDSRRRFAANKWARICRDLEGMSGHGSEDKAIFAQELIRVWHEDPGQTQLLHHALELGLEKRDVSRVLNRLKHLKGGSTLPSRRNRNRVLNWEKESDSFGYYAYVLSYLFDAMIASKLKLKKWPMVNLAKEVLRLGWVHPILTNKAHHFLLGTTAKLSKWEIGISSARRDGAWFLRQTLDGYRPAFQRMSEAEEVAIVCALPLSDLVRLRRLRTLLDEKSGLRRIVFLRSLLLRHPDAATELARAADTQVFELDAFRPPSKNVDQRPAKGLLYRRILDGAFQHPASWVKLASQLGEFVRRDKNHKTIAEGLLNPFAIAEDKNGELSLSAPQRQMDTYQGDAEQGAQTFIKANTRPWALPVGLVLRAAATARPRDLLGVAVSGRYGLAGTFGSLLKTGAKLPERAGNILDKLFAWHGSRMKGYRSVRDFVHEVKSLAKNISENSADNSTLCEVDLLQPDVASQTDKLFHVVICQIPSFPTHVNDAMIRRALAIAQLILEQKKSENSCVDLVVFPELSVPIASIGTLRRFAKQTGTMVLAGLELRKAPDGNSSLNELMWIVPRDADNQRLVTLFQQKIHVTLHEQRMHPPISAANPPVIWRINGPKGRLAAMNCYEFTDLVIRNLLRGRVEGLVIAANNQDVTTFDNLIESTHYDLFSHVILVNAEGHGGSAVRAPYKEQWHRRIFDTHGSDLFSVNVCSLNLNDFRSQDALAPSLPRRHRVDRTKPTKFPPAGFRVHS